MPSTQLSRRGFSRRGFLAAAATASATLAAGCSGSDGVPATERWPQFGFDARNTAHNPDAEGPRKEPNASWVHVAGSYYRNSTQPLVGDAVFANTGYEGLFALDPADGTVRWHDDRSYKALDPALADGTVAVPGRYGFRGVAADGGLRAFGRTARFDRWRTDLDYPQSPPTVADGVLVAGVGMGDYSPGGGRVAAVDLADGTVLWEFPVETSVWGAPAVADGVVYAAARARQTEDGRVAGAVHAVSLADGEEVWSRSLGESPRFNPVDAPVVDDDRLYLPTGTGPLLALTTDAGEEVWRFDPPEGVQASPALADGTLYVGCLDGTLRALDAETGQPEWTAEGEKYWGGPTVGKRGVFAAGSEGEVASWTRAGRERWRVRIDPRVSGSPVPADGRLFVGTNDGLLYALERPE